MEEIKEQLAYREANQEKVAAFRVTRTLGEGMKVLLSALFLVSSKAIMTLCCRLQWIWRILFQTMFTGFLPKEGASRQHPGYPAR